jgi:glycosyltransferase involved in cell wall biosynthesis
VFGSQDISGGARVIFEHVNRLATRGYRVEVWGTANSGKPYFKCNAPFKIYSDEQLGEPDIVVMTDPGFIPAVKAHRRQRSTYLLVQHDNEWVSEATGSTTYATLLRDDKRYFESGRCEILVVSPWLQEVMREKYGLASYLVPNGVDEKMFYPCEPLVSPRRPLALVFYDPQVWKGFGEAMSALEIVRQTVPDLRAGIVGRYFPEVPRIEGVSFGFPHPVIYFNRPEQDELASIFCSATVFLSASWKEGFGLPGLEAMACGVPVVTTDSGGNRDFIINDMTAVVVPQNEPVKIAEGILKVLSNEKLRHYLKRNGIKKAREFSWEASVDKLEEAFRKTCT